MRATINGVKNAGAYTARFKTPHLAFFFKEKSPLKRRFFGSKFRIRNFEFGTVKMAVDDVSINLIGWAGIRVVYSMVTCDNFVSSFFWKLNMS